MFIAAVPYAPVSRASPAGSTEICRAAVSASRAAPQRSASTRLSFGASNALRGFQLVSPILRRALVPAPAHGDRRILCAAGPANQDPNQPKTARQKALEDLDVDAVNTLLQKAEKKEQTERENAGRVRLQLSEEDQKIRDEMKPYVPPPPRPRRTWQPAGPVPPASQTLAGSAMAGGFAVGFYYALSAIATAFASKPVISDNYIVIRTAGTLRTFIIGLMAMGMSVFGAAAVGLLLLGIQTLLKPSSNAGTPSKPESKPDADK